MKAETILHASRGVGLGYYRGDCLAGRGTVMRVAVEMAEIQAALRGDRSCWQRERGRTREGLTPAIGAALSVALVRVGSLTPDPGQALAQGGPVPGVLLLDLVRQEPGRLPQIQWVDHQTVAPDYRADTLYLVLQPPRCAQQHVKRLASRTLRGLDYETDPTAPALRVNQSFQVVVNYLPGFNPCPHLLDRPPALTAKTTTTATHIDSPTKTK